jgi:hypothetical protein
LIRSPIGFAFRAPFWRRAATAPEIVPQLSRPCPELTVLCKCTNLRIECRSLQLASGAAGNDGRMARTARRPRTVIVPYRSVPYELDLVRCRRALVDRQVAGDFETIDELAGAVGISRSTASRFFAGCHTSLAVTLNTLKALHLKFEDVAKPAQLPEGDDITGAPPARTKLR